MHIHQFFGDLTQLLEGDKMNTSLPRATLFYNTEETSVYSSIMGVEYKVSIWLPSNYLETNQKYPVIYALDGETNFGLVTGIVSCLVWGQVMPECLVVGIGHDVNSMEAWWQARAVDFNPPKNPALQEPEFFNQFKDRRSPDFLRFFKNELIPLIESAYRADPDDRCLAGYSWGGQFSLYTLFHEPDLFQRYFIGSAIWEQNLPYHLAFEERYASQFKSLPVRTFFSVGDLEDDQVPFFHQFMDVLCGRNYEDFSLEKRVFKNKNHGSACPMAYFEGLKALYYKNS